MYGTNAILFHLLAWQVRTLNEAVNRELDALPADMRARFSRIGLLISAVGFERVGAPHTKHLTGPLWEIRLSGRNGIALYVATTGRQAVVRAFVKKTRRTPRKETDVWRHAGGRGSVRRSWPRG